MQAQSKQVKTNAQTTSPTGKVDIHAVREGLAMVMDGLRVMEAAGAKVSKASILFDGKICLLPVVEIEGVLLGISVTEDGSRTFTTNGVSVMDKMVTESDTHA